MKKHLVLLQLLLLLALSPAAHALEGEGTIDEIIACSDGTWKTLLLFKLSDGQWFGTYSDYHTNAPHDYDSDTFTAMVLMVFSANQHISIRATYSTLNKCGVSAAMIHTKVGDYMKVTRE